MSDKPKQYSDLKTKSKEDYQEVTLFRNPITIISTILVLIYEQIMKLTNYLLTHRKVMIALILILLSSFFEGPHKQVNLNSTLFAYLDLK